jgi:small subunit ribosomal protein S17
MESNKTTKPRVLKGEVVSNKMKDTVVVRVNRYFKHPKYGKYIVKSKRYKAHDAGNVCAIGDAVLIEETRPISKDKTFKIKERTVKVSEDKE